MGLNLVYHCLKDESIAPLVNSELFVSTIEIENYIIQLKNEGANFKLPWEVQSKSDVSITFDDGYFNNSLFLPIAQKYNIPFVVFLTSYNIENQIPYIWDIWPHNSPDNQWNFVEEDYKNFYNSLEAKDYSEILSSNAHRPFTFDELKEFSESPLVHFAVHTHYHQPLIFTSRKAMEENIEKNIKFLAQFSNSHLKDLALPCGFLSKDFKSYVESKFERIYTIDAEKNAGKYIGRVSLVSPSIGLSLGAQVLRTQSPLYPLKRWLARVRCSNKVLGPVIGLILSCVRFFRRCLNPQS